MKQYQVPKVSTFKYNDYQRVQFCDAKLISPKLFNQLKQVLTRHPGMADVHVTLVADQRQTLLKLTESLRVNPTSALMGDLKALQGTSCLTS